MTITETTPSERIGTPRIKMDLIFKAKDLYKTVIRGLTPKGHLWIRDNMAHDSNLNVTVDTEFAEELKEQMRKDGLNV